MALSVNRRIVDSQRIIIIPRINDDDPTWEHCVFVSAVEIFWSSWVKPQSNKRKTELDINLMQIVMDWINLFLLLQFVRFIFLIELNTEGVIVTVSECDQRKRQSLSISIFSVWNVSVLGLDFVKMSPRLENLASLSPFLIGHSWYCSHIILQVSTDSRSSHFSSEQLSDFIITISHWGINKVLWFW